MHREKVIACERGGTYKYFLDRDRVFAVWRALEMTYGPVRRNEQFATMEVRGTSLLFRATLLGNPITVFRLPPCTPADVDAFHALIEFEEHDAA